jgi:hypothetical protein
VTISRIFGPKRDEVIGRKGKLHNEELHNLCTSPNIIRMIKPRRMRWARHVARMGKRNTYRVLVGKPGGKTPVGRPRRRLEDNIKIDLREVQRGTMDWIHLTQNREQWRAFVNTVMNG